MEYIAWLCAGALVNLLISLIATPPESEKTDDPGYIRIRLTRYMLWSFIFLISAIVLFFLLDTSEK